MNEVHVRHFQIEPYQNESPDIWFANDGRCMFMNHCFDMHDIKRISPVLTYEYRSFFYFEIIFSDDHKITFDYSTKADATRAQCTLAAAYTRSGNFKPKTETE